MDFRKSELSTLIEEIVVFSDVSVTKNFDVVFSFRIEIVKHAIHAHDRVSVEVI